jgi:hypothetical protein
MDIKNSYILRLEAELELAKKYNNNLLSRLETLERILLEHVSRDGENFTFEIIVASKIYPIPKNESVNFMFSIFGADLEFYFYPTGCNKERFNVGFKEHQQFISIVNRSNFGVNMSFIIRINDKIYPDEAFINPAQTYGRFINNDLFKIDREQKIYFQIKRFNKTYSIHPNF